MTIQAITFDFWSTLYESRNIDYAQRLLMLKEAVEGGSGASFELEQFETAVDVARDAWSQTWIEQHRTIGADEWLGIILDELQITLPPDVRREIRAGMENSVLNETPILVPEAKAVLAELAADYRLAIISDTGLTPGRVLRQILEKDGIIEYFTYLTFSDEVGRSKPHPEAFLSTLKQLETDPAKAVHVGDLLRTDIAGAKGVNMRAVQYVGINQDDERLGGDTAAMPDAIITNHAELLLLLEAWGNGHAAPHKMA